eukprot:1154222-Pelagomonas_calceolata.AAC.4
MASSIPRLILVMRVERSLLKSVSGASKFVRLLDRMKMKLQSELGGIWSVKTKLFIGLQCVRDLDDSTHT